jgi:hypothetical protein
MESVAVNEQPEATVPPSRLAFLATHVLIGLLAGAVTQIVFRQRFAVALVVAGIAVTVHSSIDAPLARRLSNFGI